MLLSMLLAWVGTAEAKQKKPEPFMWGVGPTIGTYLLPFDYPYSFPKEIRDSDPTMQGLEGDVQLGAKGTIYMNRDYRLWGHGYLHLGNKAGYNGRGITLGLDKVLLRDNGINLYVGAGGGLGRFKFDQSDVGKLDGRQIYLRGNIGALYRNVNQAYDISLFGIVGNTSNQTFTPASSEEAADINGGVYMAPLVLGVEATVYFGDFKPNKKKGNRNRR